MADEYRINSSTGDLDKIGLSQTTANGLYLKLDQTTPQTVLNDKPIFNAGAKSNGDIILKAGQKLIFDGA